MKKYKVKVEINDVAGATLSYLRNLRGMNQREFAYALVTTASSLSKYESGIRTVSLELLLSSASLLNLSLLDLVGFIDRTVKELDSQNIYVYNEKEVPTRLEEDVLDTELDERNTIANIYSSENSEVLRDSYRTVRKFGCINKGFNIEFSDADGDTKLEDRLADLFRIPASEVVKFLEQNKLFVNEIKV